MTVLPLRNRANRLDEVKDRWGALDGRELVAAVVAEFPSRIAVTSSFGAEAAVLLDLVAQVDAGLPVIFVDTDALFDETIAYRERLVRWLGLRDVRIARPGRAEIERTEELWRTDADACCRLRKVLPYERAAAGFDVLIDGRKGFHGGSREDLCPISAGPDGVIKVSPLARWTEADIQAAFTSRGLPRHPLVAQGYRSIGCWPCTRPTAPDEPARAGRWAGGGKTECGIHTFTNGDGI